jgi:hypothetical protein
MVDRSGRRFRLFRPCSVLVPPVQVYAQFIAKISQLSSAQPSPETVQLMNLRRLALNLATIHFFQSSFRLIEATEFNIRGDSLH